MPSMGRYHRNIFQEKKRYQSALLQRSDMDHPTYIIDADFRDWSDIVLRKTQRALKDLTQVLNSQGGDAGFLATVQDSWKLYPSFSPLGGSAVGPDPGAPYNNFVIGGYLSRSEMTPDSPEHGARAYIGGFAATLFHDTDYKCVIKGAFNTDLAAGIHRKYTSVVSGFLYDDRASWTPGVFAAANGEGRPYTVRLYSDSYTITDNTATRLTLAAHVYDASVEPLPAGDRFYYIELRAAAAGASETVQVYLDCHLEDHGMAEDVDLNHNPGGTPLEAMRRTKLIQQVVLMPPPAAALADTVTLSPIVDYTDLGGVRHHVRKMGSFVLAAGANTPADAAAITNLVQPLGQDLREHIADSTNPHGWTLNQDVLFAKAIYGDVPVEGGGVPGPDGLLWGEQLNVVASLFNLLGNLTASGNLAVDGLGDSHIGTRSTREVASATTALTITFDKTTFNKVALSDDTTRGGDVEVEGVLSVSREGFGVDAAVAASDYAVRVGGYPVPAGMDPDLYVPRFGIKQDGRVEVEAGDEPRIYAKGTGKFNRLEVYKVSPSTVNTTPGNSGGPCPMDFTSGMSGVQTWVDASDFHMHMSDTSSLTTPDPDGPGELNPILGGAPTAFSFTDSDDALPPLAFGVASLDRYVPKMAAEGLSWGRTNAVGDTTAFGGETFALSANSWAPTLVYNLCNAYQAAKFGDTGTITFNAVGAIEGGAGYRFPDKAPVLDKIDFLFGLRYPKTTPAWAGIAGTSLVQFHLHGRNVDNLGREGVYALGAGRTAWEDGGETAGDGHPSHLSNFFDYTDLLPGGLQTSNICTHAANYLNYEGVAATYSLGGNHGASFTARVVTASEDASYHYQNVFVSMDLSGMSSESRSLRMRTPLKLVVEAPTFAAAHDLKITFAGCVTHATCHALGGF
jgi:hypothetical protein